MSDSNKEEKRKAWNFATNINQLDGEYKPSELLLELIEKEINGEIETDEIEKLLVKKYTQEDIEERRKKWNNSIALNQLDGEWIPDEEYMELVEKEISGEITTQQMIEILNKKYLKK